MGSMCLNGAASQKTIISYLLILIIYDLSVFIKAIWKDILDKYIFKVPKYEFSRDF